MKKKLPKKISRNIQALSYPLPIRGEEQDKIIAMLKLSKKAAQQYYSIAYKPEILDELAGSNRKAYKILEPLLVNTLDFYIPSRINRGILEVVGRTLRAIHDRRNLFNALMSLSDDPKKWNYQKLIEEKGIYAKSEYVKNLQEQTYRFYAENNRIPKDFFEFQATPCPRNAVISYAPDDGQSIHMEKKGNRLEIALKVVNSDEPKNHGEWIHFSIPLPEYLQDKKPLAPDLRLACIHGKWLPVLDYKVEVLCEKKQKTSRFLTVDWGTRKLITVCVFDQDGTQVGRPIFLKFDPIKQKLWNIRQEISILKSKRDCLPSKNSLWHKYNRDIALRWRKFKALNKALSHLASSMIVLIAQLYECSGIYIEWLKSFKSKNKSADLNWTINTTVRQAIYDKVAYKGKLVGITLHKPLPPAYTSQYCPRCGKHGIHVRASDRLDIHDPKGGWFFCQNCNFNADRDYVACCNLARKALYGNALKNQTKGVVYKKTLISDLPLRQSSSPRERLFCHLKGWNKAVFLRPGFFAGTLRS